MGYLGEHRRLFNVPVYHVGDFSLKQESELLCFLISFKICNHVGFIMFFERKKRIFLLLWLFKNIWKLPCCKSYTFFKISFWNRLCSITNSAVLNFTHLELIFCLKYTQSPSLPFQFMVTLPFQLVKKWSNKQTAVCLEIILSYSLLSYPTYNLSGNSCASILFPTQASSDDFSLCPQFHL